MNDPITISYTLTLPYSVSYLRRDFVIVAPMKIYRVQGYHFNATTLKEDVWWTIGTLSSDINKIFETTDINEAYLELERRTDRSTLSFRVVEYTGEA